MFDLLPRRPASPNLLVGTDHFDDAGVYQLTDDIALVQSVDFFTPVVDDPADFGRIAAANALSDLYAMGAKPLTAMNLVGFPSDELPMEVLAAILRGAGEMLDEADVTLVGGHTVDDIEPKFGLAVSGIVHPKSVVTNSGAECGDRLVLTKPLGIGVTTTAMKHGDAPAETAAAAVAAMRTLNRTAAEAMQACGARACTDVTGFGLLGHLHEMALASGLAAVVHAADVPCIPGAEALANGPNLCGGTQANRRHLDRFVTLSDQLANARAWLLFDAITSGGLLIAVPPDRVAALLARLTADRLTQAAEIGEFVNGDAGHIRVAEGSRRE